MRVMNTLVRSLVDLQKVLCPLKILRFADGQVFSVAPAPAEGQRLLSIMTDDQFESICNPDKFPYGAFNSSRDRKITYRKYFNQRLLDQDGI